MPARPRRVRRPRHELTLDRDVVLSFGPWPRLPSEPPSLRPGSAEWGALLYCFEQNRDRYGPGSWAWIAFGPKADVDAALLANELVPVETDKNEPVD
jgi:hypothetical protein